MGVDNMINYAGEKVFFNGCPGCAYAKGEFNLPCGIAYENDLLVLSQDWELPIEGFMVVSPKRCVEKYEQLTAKEKMQMMEVVDKTIKILRRNNVCDRFNVLFEEKENRHFHIWIMPRHKWMSDLVGDIVDHIGDILEYAKENFRTEKTINQIKNISNIIKQNFSD